MALLPFRAWEEGKEEIEVWAEQLECQFTLLEIEEEPKKIAYCKAHLGRVLGDVRGRLTGVQTWRETKTVLLDEFGKDISKTKARSKLRTLKLEQNNVRTLKREVEKYVSLAFPHLSPEERDIEVREALIQACPAVVRRHCTIHQDATTKELMSTIKRVLEAQLEKDESLNRPMGATGDSRPKSTFKCYFCLEPGHISRQCPKKGTNYPSRPNPNQLALPAPQVKETGAVRENRVPLVEEVYSDEGGREEIALMIGSSPCERVNINGIPAHMLVDTGAARSCLMEEFFLLHHDSLGAITPPEVTLVGAGGKPIESLGATSRVELDWKGKKVETKLCVLRGSAAKGIHGYLGMDVMRTLGVQIQCGPAGVDTQPLIVSAPSKVTLPPHTWKMVDIRAPLCAFGIFEEKKKRQNSHCPYPHYALSD